MTWPVLVFDVESIPDIAGLRSLSAPEAPDAVALPDPEVLARWQAGRAAEGKSDFMPLHLQRVLVLSCVFRNAEGMRVHSFVDREVDGRSQEAKVIQGFYGTIEKHVPELVSWNGAGFDLPVLNYRALKHGLVAPKFWDLGEDDREFKWNNYISRYHLRHLDLMDLLSMYQPRASAPLDALAKLCGFPGKLGMDGSAVYPAYLAGGLEDIRRYCETDVMNTYLLYCRYQKLRGGFTESEYDDEMQFVRGFLADSDEPHWREYLDAWK